MSPSFNRSVVPADPVVVTGVGSVSPWGWSTAELERGLMAGAAAVEEPQRFDVSGHRTRLAGEVSPPPDELGQVFSHWRRLSRAEQFALGAAREAMVMAGLEVGAPELSGAGAFFGGSTAAMAEAEDFYHRLLDQSRGRPWLAALAAHQLNGPGDEVARRLGMGGPVESFSAACASGGMALGAALDALRDGEVEVALAGGSDALCQLTYAGFNSLRAVDSERCQPFREARQGLNLGEGAGVVVMERRSHARRRGATELAVVLGAGATCDAHHMTAPHPQGEGASRAILRALEDAEISAEEVSFMNAHGTGTPQNDVAEWAAIERIFGARAGALPVTSTKGSVGHLLGSSGAIEAVATVVCLRAGQVHPTPGEGPVDPALGVDLVLGTPRSLESPAVAVSTSFAFGGANAAVVLASAGASGDSGEVAS